ncbi:MAG: transcriptional antiterminator [Candidatus Dadabacteria bacterium]|nr:MAG: transcriptional antiterminator [Candidatus Dadabacteria bacterium]
MKKWFVIYTKANQEIKVTEQLKKIGISCYCPTVKIIKQYSDRKKKTVKPVIPSYVFVLIEENRRNDIFSVFGVVRYMFWLGKPAVVREKEIELMKKYLNGEFQSVSLTNFTKGQLHKISEGVFAGKIGRIIEIQKNKIKLQLESLGMIVTLKLEAA